MPLQDETRPIEFTQLELQVIERALSPTAHFMDESSLAPSKDLCLVIGSALWAEGPISLCEEDVWILRERVDLWTMMGSSPVGLSIKKKLYSLLLEFDADKELQGLPINDTTTGPSSSDIDEGLKKFRGSSV